MFFIVHCSNVSRLNNSMGDEVHHCRILLLGDGSTSLDIVGEKEIPGSSREVVAVKHQDGILMAVTLHDGNPLLHNGVYWGSLQKFLIVLLQRAVQQDGSTIRKSSAQFINPEANLVLKQEFQKREEKSWKKRKESCTSVFCFTAFVFI